MGLVSHFKERAYDSVLKRNANSFLPSEVDISFERYSIILHNYFST
jgi:hypothetical protein